MTDKQNKQEQMTNPELVFQDGIGGKIEQILWMVQKAYNSDPEDTHPISISEGVEMILAILSQTRQEAYNKGQAQALDWVEKEVVGEDEELDIIKDLTIRGNVKFKARDKITRNKFRAKQRQLINQRKNERRNKTT